jgi:integrase
MLTQAVDSETAIEWAGSAPSLCQRARRLGQVIRFARYIRAEDPHHELPPTVYGSETRPRPVPYIFSEDEIKRILRAASELGKRNIFRGYTYNTLLEVDDATLFFAEGSHQVHVLAAFGFDRRWL